MWFCLLRRTRRTSKSMGIVLAAAGVVAASVGFGGALIPSPANAVVGPTGSGFTVTPGDLAFILKQIKISEQHSATQTASDPCGTLVGSGPDQIPDRLTSYGLRTVDGSCNNLFPGRETFAAADQPFPRFAGKVFKNAEAAPAGFPAQASSSYAQKKGLVFDSEPRTISNLIVDQTNTNPAALAAAQFPIRSQGNGPSSFPCTTDPGPTDPPTSGTPAGCTPSGKTLFIDNVTTDVGLSPPYNSLFTFFGQFFDHGVDQTVKSGGTVFVPLKDDDPLVTLGPDNRAGTGDEVPAAQRFMVLTRAENQPGNDGILGDDPATGVDESADDVQDADNTDSPWVDQSQTYTSHSSHQAFLREYVLNGAGRPVSTGKLLGGTGNGATGMATWASVKAQAATMLGLQLRDVDVTDIPALLADPYGKFIPGPLRGLPQYLLTNGDTVEGDRTTPVAPPANVQHFHTPFLTDIAHNADPGTVGPCATQASGTPTGCKSPDTDSVASADFAAQPLNTYDDEMLDAHFCAGDGRVNENIALTTVHQVFHSEHDRLVDYIKGVLTADATTTPSGVAALPDWQLPTAQNPAGWNGERLFQAARFVTEMEYQHLVFEEFARKVQPLVHIFRAYSPDINAAIPAEFAHAVYRFGHSMLDDEVARRNEDGTDNSLPLLTAFLNPPEFFNNGAAAGDYTPEQAAGAVVMGSSDQVGNELDEFVTETLRSNLLGLPLDLATLNMTRARDAGVPPLNQLRRDIFGQTNDGQLAPYTSWSDFGQHLKHPESLINFVAAYGRHTSITGATTLAGKRAAARAIVDPQTGDTPPADAAQFMFSTGPWVPDGAGVTTTGVDDIDLWIGGLSEITNVFGGLLGSTFNYVFQSTLESLQDGDRFYYLNRTPGMNLRTQLEGNSFAELIQRNTDGTNTLKADAFATADCKFQLATLSGTAAGFTAQGATVTDDPATGCNENALLQRRPDGTIFYKTVNAIDPVGINGQGVYNGTAGVDRIAGGNDNDTFWGGPGNDILEGQGGDDVTLGGDGNDILTDLDGFDVLKGGPGNDAIDTGTADDISMGGDGQDFINGGQGDNEHFGGEGTDFIIGGAGGDAVFGDGGSDWIQGGTQQDLLIGDHAAPFFDDPAEAAPGNEVFVGQTGENDYDAEGGDDLMAQNAAVDRNAGSAGFDWAFHQYDTVGADDDMAINNNLVGLPLPVVVNRDRWQETEANSGSAFNDIIRGDDAIPSTQGAAGGAGFTGCDALDQAGIDRIPGLDPIVPPLTGNAETDVEHVPGLTCPLTGGFWGAGNILIGGAGSDTLEGRGGDDLIDGDKYLTVGIRVGTAPGGTGTVLGVADTMESRYLRDGTGALTGPTLQAAVFAGTVDPGNLAITRQITTPATGAGSDTARFSGNRADYLCGATVATATQACVGAVLNSSPLIVRDIRAVPIDGTDQLTGMEKLQFLDITVAITPLGTFTPASLAFGSVLVGNTTSPTQTVTLTNGGAAPLVLSATPTIAGTNPAEFTRTGGTCVNGTSLAAAQSPPVAASSCTIIVRFIPQSVGNKSAVARVIDNNNGTAGSIQDVPLTGTGLASQPTAGVTPASLGFAATNVGAINATPQTVTLSNTGTAVLNIASITTTGDFSRVPGGTTATTGGTCTTTLNAGANCTVRVRFTPTAAGPRAGLLTFTDNSGNTAGATQTVTLSGTGVAVNGVATVTPSPVAFGGSQINVAKNITATLRNTGSGTLNVTGLAVAGTDITRQGGTCAATPFNLTANATCTIIVRLLPTAAGARTGTLTVTSNSGGVANTSTVTQVTGTGVAATIAATPSPLPLGSNSVGPVTGGNGVTANLTVRNTGPAGSLLAVSSTQVIAGVTSGNNQFTVNSNNCPTAATLASNATCTIVVRFRASGSAGARNATLRLNSNAPTTPTNVPLTATATPAGLLGL
jgi:Ca2+-binding RTX toxin-like protein